MKHVLQSKTLWANAIMAALSAAELNLHMLKPLLGESSFGVISFAVITINVILRFTTTGPVTLVKPSAE